MVAKSETGRNRILQFTPPRGVRLFLIQARPQRPFAVQWAIDGRTKTKTFETQEAQEGFAAELSRGATEIGLDAYRLDPNEARTWRAFRARIGAETALDAVALCWERYGRKGPSLTVSEAVAQFMAAKKAEGLSPQTLGHYGPVFARLSDALGRIGVGAVTRSEMSHWVASIEGADESRRTHFKRARMLFEWLRENGAVSASPMDGLRPVRVIQEEVQTWTVDEFAALFEKNEGEPPELLGRLACECFAGLRFGSAAQLTGADFQDGGIVLPAAKIKTRRRQFIDGLPDNLWWWVRRSEPAKWQMTPRQYLEAKSRAVTRAGLRSVHNACRHGFGTYAMSAWKDAAKVAAVLCHTNQKMLYQHYKGRASEEQGAAYFLIYPTGACPLPLNSPRGS